MFHDEWWCHFRYISHSLFVLWFFGIGREEVLDSFRWVYKSASDVKRDKTAGIGYLILLMDKIFIGN